MNTTTTTSSTTTTTAAPGTSRIAIRTDLCCADLSSFNSGFVGDFSIGDICTIVYNGDMELFGGWGIHLGESFSYDVLSLSPIYSFIVEAKHRRPISAVCVPCSQVAKFPQSPSIPDPILPVVPIGGRLYSLIPDDIAIRYIVREELFFLGITGPSGPASSTTTTTTTSAPTTTTTTSTTSTTTTSAPTTTTTSSTTSTTTTSAPTTTTTSTTTSTTPNP